MRGMVVGEGGRSSGVLLYIYVATFVSGVPWMPPKHYDLAQYTKWHKKSPQNSKILSEEVRTSEANLYQNLK